MLSYAYVESEISNLRREASRAQDDYEVQRDDESMWRAIDLETKLSKAEEYLAHAVSDHCDKEGQAALRAALSCCDY